MVYEKSSWKADPNGLRRWIAALGIKKGDSVLLSQLEIEWSPGEIANLYSQNPETISAIYRGVGNKDGAVLFETSDRPGVVQREGMSAFYGWRQFETIKPRATRQVKKAA